MSIQAIKQYYSEVEKIIDFGGTKKETAIRNAFYNLLNDYAKQKGLMLIPEITIKTKKGKNVTPDGTLKDTLRQDWGYWESKDEADDIDEEIKKKFAKGYPSENILFEDSNTAVLIQNGSEAQRAKFKDAKELDRIINSFISFERPEVKNFRKAIELFKQDIPKVTDTLRDMLEVQEKENPKFVAERDKFLKLCHDSINPEVTKQDVREMMIQHVLTEDIFNTVFGETQFHRENNIAHQLETVINTFFTGQTKRTALSAIQHYYQAINAAAAGIADHHEKQNFLKVVYETFYKSYNPKAADRLGVVYTPNEIVNFMIQSTDYLLNKHFGKFLEDRGVEILDPATGTGTFICDIIDHLRKEKIEYKYKNEIHANEVAILPYYISNLNIEFTYKQRTGKYAEFENLCFVDTLDNMGFSFKDKQTNMFAPFSEENTKRIKRQNDKKISVVIGNPPYNAKQANYNFQNSNKAYKQIDARIKDTFIYFGTAQNQNVLYDMYARFYRWAMDRIDDRGVIAFITNNSFINSRTFDGFRKCVQDEFQYAYVIDLGGNINELSGRDGIFLNEKHTIFGKAAAVGIAMMFLVKDISQKNKETKCQIFYIHPTDIRATRDEKLAYLSEHSLKEVAFEHIQPDKNNNWINLSDNDFEELLPLVNKDFKKKIKGNALFELYSPGIQSSRDEWAFDFSQKELKNKIEYHAKIYNECVDKSKDQKDKLNIQKLKNDTIKWSSSLEQYLVRGLHFEIKKEQYKIGLYRPFIKQHYYYDKFVLHRISLSEQLYGKKLSENNHVISFMTAITKPFSLLGINVICDNNFLSPAAGGTFCLPFFRYDKNDNRIENITDWGFNQFVKQYGKKGISKEDIFHYTYSVLHNPAYRKKYELNLKREFPRIPFYNDFWKWAKWGKALMDSHINYEKAKPYNLKEHNTIDIEHTGNNEIFRVQEPEVMYAGKEKLKVKLKADKENGAIEIDEATTLRGIPKEAWDYKLGNRSALEWVLDQYKEKKPSDPTIAEKFNTYRFADYKDHVIDLLKRVCTVSVETMEIISEMEKEDDK